MTEPLTRAEVKRLASSLKVVCFFADGVDRLPVGLIFPEDNYAESVGYNTLEGAYEALLDYGDLVNPDD